MKALFEQLGYTLDLVNKIWIKPTYEGIAYNDGDEIEARLAAIIQQASDLSVLSSELRQHCTDWPSLYHLSGTRANIMRPFVNVLKGDILEIGAGCGAITRYLGECGANVLALEGSPRRAAIARSRTRDLENVTVLAERFDHFQCDRQFDVITLIGVLEYANLFTSGENPPLAMLERVHSLLKPEGKLIIAIENQLGLKYFAGAPEDHLGQPMIGIEGRYREDQPRTFGRAVLANMLKQAGFNKSEFLAPLPDYKFPVSILTENGIASNDFDASAFAWQSVRYDLQLPVYCGFSLELAWPEIFHNGLSLDVANSFLIIASPNAIPLTCSTILAYHYSTNRLPAYCKETVFTQADDENILVQYRTIGVVHEEINHTSDLRIRFTCPNTSEYVLGKPLSLEFVHLVTKDGWSFDQVGNFIRRYLSILEIFANSDSIEISTASAQVKLPGEFFDIIPQNIIIRRDNGNPAIIDKEWQLIEEIEIGFLIFRSLLLLLSSVTRYGRHASGENITYYQFIEGAFATAGLKLQNDDYARYISLEARIQQDVTGRITEKFLSWSKDQPLPILNLNQVIAERDREIGQLSHVVSEYDQEIQRLKQSLKHLSSELSHLRAELSAVYRSRSWQLTRPLRALRRLPRLQQKSPLWRLARNTCNAVGAEMRRHGLIGFARRAPYYLSNYRSYLALLAGRPPAADAGLFSGVAPVPRNIRLHPELISVREPIDANVSVVIPTLNAGYEFPWLLRKLRGQRGFGELEIVIVDSGSRDGTVEFARAAGCTVVEIPPTDFSHSYARNTGADTAHGDYLLFMVQDAYPIGDYWIYGMLRYLVDHKEEKIAAVSCAEYSRSDSDMMYDSMINTHYRFLGCLEYDRIGEYHGDDHLSLRAYGQLSDVSCLIPRSTFGHYRYRGDYAEDLDLGIRLIKDGYRVAMLASVKVVHSHNRPAYYYLKRSFVDVIFLVDLFEDFVYPHIESTHGLIAGIVSVAAHLSDWLTGFDELCSRGLLHDEISELISRWRHGFVERHCNPHSRLGDVRLDAYVDSLAARYLHSSKLDSDAHHEARRFLDAFLSRLEHFNAFVGRVYGAQDAVLRRDLRDAVCKIFAATSGSSLGFMYMDLAQTEGSQRQMAETIKNELKEGI